MVCIHCREVITALTLDMVSWESEGCFVPVDICWWWTQGLEGNGGSLMTYWGVLGTRIMSLHPMAPSWLCPAPMAVGSTWLACGDRLL